MHLLLEWRGIPLLAFPRGSRRTNAERTDRLNVKVNDIERSSAKTLDGRHSSTGGG